MDKFTEVEYTALAEGISSLARKGLLAVSEYHSLLVKLASNRETANSKPEVFITSVKYEPLPGGKEIAHGYALNHPRLGASVVRTSLVVSKADDGSSFDTLNTRYVIVANPSGSVSASKRVEISTLSQNDD